MVTGQRSKDSSFILRWINENRNSQSYVTLYLHSHMRAAHVCHNCPI